jgi:hypothetical protein
VRQAARRSVRQQRRPYRDDYVTPDESSDEE